MVDGSGIMTVQGAVEGAVIIGRGVEATVIANVKER